MKKLLCTFGLILFTAQAMGSVAPVEPVKKPGVVKGMAQALLGDLKVIGYMSLKLFDEEIRPQVIKAETAYVNAYGDQVSEAITKGVPAFFAPTAQLTDSIMARLQKTFPETYADISLIPTPIKVNYEKALWAYYKAVKNRKEIKQLPDRYKAGAELVMQGLDAIQREDQFPQSDRDRLNSLLNDIRPFVPDAQIRDCLHVYIMDTDINNSYSTGCHVFVSKKMLSLEDRYLRAVLSHEVTHSSRGDNLRILGGLMKAILKSFGNLAMQEFVWLTTDEMDPMFAEVMQDRNALVPVKNKNPDVIAAVGFEKPQMQEAGFLEAFAKQFMHGMGDSSFQVEVNADIGGTKILNAAGYSAEDMIDVLYILHNVPIGADVSKTKDKEGLRTYPSLNKRLTAVRNVMKF